MKIKSLFQTLILSLLSFSALAADDSGLESGILKHVNSYRQQHHMNTLQNNAIIASEARKHSEDMASHRMKFGHKNFQKRIRTLYARIPGCNAGAENVAYNYKDAGYLVSQWLTSPGHRRNIRGNYNLSGVGVARDNQGKLYYTQMFLRCNPK